MSETTNRILALTTQIAAAYLGARTVGTAAVPGLIRAIQETLTDLVPNRPGEPARTRPADLRPPPRAAVDVRKSVFADHLVCLEDGEKMTMLKRHLRTAHAMSPEQYHAKWQLPASYPMVAPNYAKTRSRLAKEAGLGRTKQPEK
jgi:predicted transcriptional regulator